MSFFTTQQRTVNIDADNHVVIRKLTYGQQQALMSAATVFEMSMTGGAGNVATGKLDPFRLKREELAAAIVSWSGSGFEDRPVTRENIEALPPDVVSIIQEAVNDLNGGATADEKKDLASITNTASSVTTQP